MCRNVSTKSIQGECIETFENREGKSHVNKIKSLSLGSGDKITYLCIPLEKSYSIKNMHHDNLYFINTKKIHMHVGTYHIHTLGYSCILLGVTRLSFKKVLKSLFAIKGRIILSIPSSS